MLFVSPKIETYLVVPRGRISQDQGVEMLERPSNSDG